MKEQVVMSPNNGALAVAVPLYRRLSEYLCTENPGYNIALTTQQERPSAYIMDMGTNATVMTAEWVEANLVFLGEL